MTSETYPNAMTANYTYNSTGEATAIEYDKTAHCKGTCPEVWFKETVTPSIHGEALSRVSTLASEQYEYDSDGRLTQVQETPAGQGCKTRLYTYNEDSDRTSLTTREPGSEGKCANSGGTTENHTYDTADRLIDTGVEYEPFGNQTKMPGADAGGKEVKASFYVDNQTREETQNSETLHYYLDPEGRNREIYNPGPKTTTVNNYSGPGATISWMSEGEKWTRNIPGIDGSLDAIQSSSGTTALQLHDLQGDIVAEASLSESETKLLKSYNSTEFGVPTTSSPPKYSWLGAVGVTTELSSGATVSGGDSYIPQLGAPLQTQPVSPPGAAPNGTYIAPYISTQSAGAANATAAFAAGAPAREAARQKAAQEQWAREHPPTSPGAVPQAECNEEVEGCGPDPEHGENSAYCSVWVSWDHYLNNRLGITGHAFCVDPEIMEIQIALRIRLPNGQFKNYERSYKEEFHNVENDMWDEFPHTWVCEEGDTYQAWVFGRYWYGAGPTVWYATAEDGHTESCSSLAPEGDPTPGPPDER